MPPRPSPIRSTIVAADDPGRAEVIRRLPAFEGHVRRQESVLHAGREFEVLFQGALLLGGEAAEAEGDQRIGHDPVHFDRFVAVLADAEVAGLQLSEGLVDFQQQVCDLGGFTIGERRLQALTTENQLFANLVEISGLCDIHGVPVFVIRIEDRAPDSAFLSGETRRTCFEIS